MKTFVFLAAAVFFMTGHAFCETMYVSEMKTVTFREGPGIGENVIENIQTGQKVERLQETGNWSHVELSDGRKGWVYSWLLTKEKPGIVQLSELEEKNRSLQKDLKTLRESCSDGKELRTSYETLKNNYETIYEENKDLKEKSRSLTTEYKKLKSEFTACEQRVIQLEQRAPDSYREMEMEYRSKLKELENQRKKLGENQRLHLLTDEWKTPRVMGTGAGIFFAGLVMGLVIRGSRKKRYYF